MAALLDQHVDFAEPFGGGGEHCLHLLVVGDVGQHRQRVDAQGAHLTGHRFSLLSVGTCIDHHVGALSRKLEGDGPPDIPPRSGYQGGFSF